MARPAFPLRIRSERLRELVREVAEREGISQNELLEQAAEHEVVARGALLADELESSAARLRAMSTGTRRALVDASVAGFAEAEALDDPLRSRRYDGPEPESVGQPSGVGAAAFSRR